MKKKGTHIHEYSEGEPLTVIDRRSEYVNQTGIVNRIGYAGDRITYYHLAFPNVNTIITFTSEQVIKEAK